MLSGGRDSTAMVIKMLQEKMPIDYILFTDTQSEFPDMYKYLHKVDAYLYRKHNKRITFLHTKKTFSEWAKGEIQKGVRKGMIRGLPMVTVPCFWKRDSKVRPFEYFLKEKGISEYTQYIGYTYSEKKRANVKDKKQRFPLIEFKMCEADVDRLLEEIDLINPLYERFHRTGCFFCPYMSNRAFYLVNKFHPHEWAEMVNIENKLLEQDNCINPQWHIRYSLKEIESMILSGEWEFQEQAENSCECQI